MVTTARCIRVSQECVSTACLSPYVVYCVTDQVSKQSISAPERPCWWVGGVDRGRLDAERRVPHTPLCRRIRRRRVPRERFCWVGGSMGHGADGSRLADDATTVAD
jgi:hypothetical protein